MNTPMAMGGSGRLETVTNPRDGENRPAILLAGASVRWAAQSLRRGMPNSRVIGLDWFGDSDTRMVCDQFHPFQTGEDSQENLSQQIQSVANLHAARTIHVGGLQVPGGGKPWQRWNRLQAIVREIAAGSDCGEFPVATPITYQCSAGRCSLTGANDGVVVVGDLIAQTSGRPIHWLWKETNSTGGMGVRSVAPSNMSNSKTSDGWMQQRVAGRSYGLVAIASADQTRILGITVGLHQRFDDRPFVYSGSRGPVSRIGDAGVSDVPWRHLQTLSEQVAKSFSLRGLFNLDFIRDASGRWWLLELNARPSASCEVIERWATDAGWLAPDDSLMRMHMEAIDGGDSTSRFDGDSQTAVWSSPIVRTQWNKRIVFANREGVVDVGRIRRRLCAESIIIELADLPTERTRVAIGEPIMTLLLRVDDRAKKMASAQLRRAIRIVQGELLP
ncbi:MAG TPA: hypothetical protein DDX19_16670 [Rhodopirellula baltica]|nr:ATP-grasp domain-containing protein [Rhodopirellula baltica]HBE64335.1 hypothetical protein [Rhodopirellula baltica]